MTGSGVQLSWNPIVDLQQLLEFHFMQNAFIAGAIVAVVAGLIGYFMVLRGQTFAGHALSHVGFAGATGALLFGVSPIAGLLALGVGSGIGMGALQDRSGHRGPANDIAIAGIFTFGLGLGLLFLQLYPGQAENAYSILFGNVLGISDSDVTSIALTGVAALGVLGLIARRLLFASLDPDIAEARGVNVRLLSIIFFALLAFAVAEAVQVVGVLLIFALLVTPAATAQRLTARPVRGIVLSVVLALLFSWAGIAIAYYAPYSVVGFYITSLAFACYLLVQLLTSAPATKLFARTNPRTVRWMDGLSQ